MKNNGPTVYPSKRHWNYLDDCFRSLRSTFYFIHSFIFVFVVHSKRNENMTKNKKKKTEAHLLSRLVLLTASNLDIQRLLFSFCPSTFVAFPSDFSPPLHIILISNSPNVLSILLHFHPLFLLFSFACFKFFHSPICCCCCLFYQLTRFVWFTFASFTNIWKFIVCINGTFSWIMQCIQSFCCH